MFSLIVVFIRWNCCCFRDGGYAYSKKMEAARGTRLTPLHRQEFCVG
ncbi:hypothetical protein HanXRQr2_Chr15g0688311 [Helianthus annuus]|uniref:Uncharacterized protein n=1 Tax=Helianthus annuus TaxID=4232 RepID=A0A9K3DZX4_HELAN|nr:hypothetical protein HanXRQr2_Chr15g0688311 [Helianthus annuus]KAJ0450839.1 hypothetical protein HanHA300_Chr15g0560781 [Helianthus annuus]KAJ0472702.1 hypothetical protein HanHA89_Chr15g0610021 [Helianthus annuus]KAJ0648306.1 hypothetical protein HanLR1_Chr15g0571401 [Helianthus annuus]